MALQAIFTMFCFLLFVGAIVHSRCVLILFSVCGLFSIILLWLLASVYTTASVALADFCYDPTPWVMHMLQDKVSKDISSYYLQCAVGRENPFERPLTVRNYFFLCDFPPNGRKCSEHVVIWRKMHCPIKWSILMWWVLWSV